MVSTTTDQVLAAGWGVPVQEPAVAGVQVAGGPPALPAALTLPPGPGGASVQGDRGPVGRVAVAVPRSDRHRAVASSGSSSGSG
jgi:hypothetical protein